MASAQHPTTPDHGPTATADDGRTMIAVAHHRYGPPEVLTTVRVPRPQARPGEVTVRVHAVAVSAAECAFRAADPAFARLASGLRRPRHPVLGGEVSGVVETVAADVRGFTPGDRVVAVSGIEMGGYAEYARMPAASVVHLGPTTDHADAVAVVEGGLTALPFLRDHAKVRPGMRVLVNGAAGSVGVAAVQLARHMGAQVTGVCSTRNLELVGSLGAHHVIDRTATPVADWPTGYDVVLDAVGRLSFREVRHVLTARGIDLTTVPTPTVLLLSSVARLSRGRRAGIAFTGLRPAQAKAADMTEMLRLAADGAVRPVVDRSVPLTRAVEAHRYVDTGRKRGSVVLRPTGDAPAPPAGT